VAFVLGTAPLYCATLLRHLTGVLDYFEVDTSARPASSFRVTCVMSIFIISTPHLRGMHIWMQWREGTWWSRWDTGR